MNAEDAEALLPLHREGRPPEGRIQKAVRYAEAHDTLRPKLAQQLGFDSRMIDVIHAIRPPENLRKKLREAGAPAVRKSAQVLTSGVLTAVCGILLIVGFCVWTVMERMERFPGRENLERMLAATNRMSGIELEPVATTTGAMGDWFYMRGFEGYALPDEMARLPVVGSRVLRQDGHAIAQLAVDRQNSILYVFHAADFGVQVPADEPWKVFGHEQWAAGLRRHGKLCYMLALRGKKADVQAFLRSLQQ